MKPPAHRKELRIGMVSGNDKLLWVGLTLSVPNFRRHLSSAFFFFILTNYRLERRLYVKLKDWMSNSVDPDETAQVSSGSMLFEKAFYHRLWQWKSKTSLFFSRETSSLFLMQLKITNILSASASSVKPHIEIYHHKHRDGTKQRAA